MATSTAKRASAATRPMCPARRRRGDLGGTDVADPGLVAAGATVVCVPDAANVERSSGSSRAGNHYPRFPISARSIVPPCSRAARGTSASERGSNGAHGARRTVRRSSPPTACRPTPRWRSGSADSRAHSNAWASGMATGSRGSARTTRPSSKRSSRPGGSVPSLPRQPLPAGRRACGRRRRRGSAGRPRARGAARNRVRAIRPASDRRGRPAPARWTTNR